MMILVMYMSMYKFFNPTIISLHCVGVKLPIGVSSNCTTIGITSMSKKTLRQNIIISNHNQISI